MKFTFFRIPLQNSRVHRNILTKFRAFRDPLTKFAFFHIPLLSKSFHAFFHNILTKFVFFPQSLDDIHGFFNEINDFHPRSFDEILVFLHSFDEISVVFYIPLSKVACYRDPVAKFMLLSRSFNEIHEIRDSIHFFQDSVLIL